MRYIVQVNNEPSSTAITAN